MLIVRNSLLTLIRKCLHLSSKRSVQSTLVTCFIISVGFSLCLRWLNIFYLQKPLDLTLSYIVFMFFLSSRTIIFINIRRYLIKIQASTWLCLVFVLLTFKIFLLTLVHAVWFFFFNVSVLLACLPLNLACQIKTLFRMGYRNVSKI